MSDASGTSSPRQLAHQFEIIVDLAVVGDDRPVRRRHRLVARRRQVDDRKAAMGEAAHVVRRPPGAVTVRPAMRNQLAHHPQ